MKYFIAFLLLFTTTLSFSQETQTSKKVTGTIVSNNTLLPLANVNIINVNKVKGTMTNTKGILKLMLRKAIHYILLQSDFNR